MPAGSRIDIGEIEAQRSALLGHCYRMLGSAFDAEDAVQETIVRAWQHADRFEERSSLRTWLYRIATNVCLDALSSRAKRARPVEDGPLKTINDPLETLPRTHWLEPVPDARALPTDANPHELAVMRQSIRLAFVAAVQHLPPRQRAVLLLMEVLGWSAAETAASLEMTPAAVNSAIQRARATLAQRNVSLLSADQTLSDDESNLLDRYVTAFQHYDVDTLVSLLREDATMSMPPYAFWLQGPESIKGWLLGRGAGCRGSKLVQTDASGAPAFAQYRRQSDGSFAAWGLVILEQQDGRISAINTFLDVQNLFPLFDLPLTLDDR
ncbi:MAG TPA: sigma-70 family RNA polymerase sigma factor [Vicinamibacterales bacterium]|nr:sigma-70 family RNA polymerase sigma factor [Vicinamibacterales bacterium]